MDKFQKFTKVIINQKTFALICTFLHAMHIMYASRATRNEVEGTAQAVILMGVQGE